MHPLEQFFWQKIATQLYHDRFETILEVEDVLVVNFDCVFERDYSIRGIDQLIYQLHKRGHGKRFLFLSEDGAILEYSSAIAAINNIRDCFDLNADTCAVICRESISIPDVTVIVREAVPYWCRVLYPTVKDIAIPLVPFSKKFAVWFHRGTFYRLAMARYLKENHRDTSYISYQELGMLHDRALADYFSDELAWANTNTPIVYDRLFPNRTYDHSMIVGADRKPYADYFIEIVVETDCLTTAWITEKTVKNLYIGKPFVVMGGAGTLAKLRSFGFQTFSPWIDETYDTINNNYERFQAITQEIDRLANLDLNQMHKELLPILEHNREVYGQYINSW